MSKKLFIIEEAKKVGDEIGVNWAETKIEEFAQGLHIELEHGLVDPRTNVTNDDLAMTGKIAWAHLNEFGDYYTRLKKMEDEAEEYWKNMKQ